MRYRGGRAGRGLNGYMGRWTDPHQRRGGFRINPSHPVKTSHLNPPRFLPPITDDGWMDPHKRRGGFRINPSHPVKTSHLNPPRFPPPITDDGWMNPHKRRGGFRINPSHPVKISHLNPPRFLLPITDDDHRCDRLYDHHRLAGGCRGGFGSEVLAE